MANNFRGTLLYYTYEPSSGSARTMNFPHQYIVLGSWKSTPNQREEIRAYRDDNTRNLTRVTAAGKKSKFSFKTRPNLHLDEVRIIIDYFKLGEQLTGGSADERKIQLYYWNDEDGEYKVGWFYRPNMDFPIKKISGNDIIYDSLELTFVEY